MGNRRSTRKLRQITLEAWLREAEKVDERGFPLVRTSDGYLVKWDRGAIVRQLVRETKLAEDIFGIEPISERDARAIAEEVEKRLLSLRAKFISGALIREMVNNVLLERAEERPEFAIYRNVLTRVGTPVYDAYLIDLGLGFEAKENANLQPNPESIPPHEVVVYDSGNGLCIGEVGPLIDSLLEANRERVERLGKSEILRLEGGELKVPAFDKNLKIRLLPVTAVIRHPGKKVYRVETENGRVVRVTEDHNFFTVKGGDLVPIPLSALKPGSLIAVPRALRISGSLKRVNLAKFLLRNCKDSELKYIYVRSPKVRAWLEGSEERIVSIVLKHGAPFTKRAYQSPEEIRRRVIPRWKRNCSMPLLIAKYLGVDLDSLDEGDLVGTWRTKASHALPAVVHATRDLGFIVGFLVAEGYLGKKAITVLVSGTGSSQTKVIVSNSDRKVLERYCAAWERTLGYLPALQPRSDPPRAVVGTRALAVLLERALGIKVAKAGEKELPAWVFEAPAEFKAGVLGGLFAGDGYGYEGELRFSTTSRKLANQVALLLLTLGIYPRIDHLKGGYEYRVYVRGQSLATLAALIGLGEQKVGIEYSDVLPVREEVLQLLRTVVWKAGTSREREWVYHASWHWRRGSLPTRSELAKLLVTVKRSALSYDVKLLSKLERLVNSDIRFERIKVIAEEGEPPFVYDFEVRPNGEEAENFVGGFGHVLLHNTAHKKKADKLSKEQYLLLMHPRLADAHLKGDLHIHDLEYFGTRPFCQDWDLRYFLYYGLMPDGMGYKTSVAGPAKHPEVAMLHSVKVLAAGQTNFAGGQGFYNYTVFLAPFLRGLDHKQIKQLAQMMFFELSVDPAEHLVVENDGEVKVVEAGSYLDKFFATREVVRRGSAEVALQPGFKVLCYDPVDGKVKLAEATAVVRHRPVEPLVRIKTRSGRVTRVTGDHSLFTVDDEGRIVPVRARDLKPGDWVITLGRVRREPSRLSKLNMLRILSASDLIEKLEGYVVELDRSVLKRHADEVRALASAAGYSAKAISTWLSRGRLPLRIAVKLELNESELANAKIAPRNRRVPYVPCLLALDKRLAKLLGYYVAEGSISKKRPNLGIQLSLTDSKAEVEVEGIVKELFGAKLVKSTRSVRFGGTIHAILFADVLGAGATAAEKRVPPVVYELDEGLVAEFLRTYHSGVGFTHREGVGFDTISRALANGLVLLLQSLGIRPTIEERDRTTQFTKGARRKIYRVLITGKRDLARLVKLMPEFKDSNKLFYALGKREAREVKRRIPLFARLRDELKRVQYTNAYNPAVKAVTAEIVLDKLGERATSIGDLKALLTGELVADEVVAVERVEPDGGYVYDVEVLGVENFVGGYLGHFLLHNTQAYVARGGQLVFSNIQLCPGVPEIWKDRPVVAYGKVGPDTYGDYEDEVRELFRAIYEVALEGDAWGKPFNFPKLEGYVTPEFFNAHYEDEWMLVHEVVAKFGSPYFDNAIPAYRGYGKGVSCYQCCAYTFTETPETDPEFEAKMNFEDGKHFSMGSWQVVTLNLPRAAYRANGNDDKLIEEVKRLMDLAVEIFRVKKKWMDAMIKNNRLPFATQRPFDPRTGKRGPPAIDFSELVYTIGIVGGNEMAQWHTGYQLHESKEAVKILVKVLLEMRRYKEELEKKTGMKLALARTPAESCAQRLAVCDLISPEFSEMAKKVVKGDVERALKMLPETRDVPVYYTNGTHVYVGAEVPLFDRLSIEHKFFPILSGGNIFHVWLGEAHPDPEALYKLTSRIVKGTQIGYFAYTKDLTICEGCSRVSPGLLETCPYCGSKTVRWWSRVTGYYQDVSGWNEAKRKELVERFRVGFTPS